MRDILLKNQKAGSSTLPALINLVQYNAVGKQADSLAEYKGTFGDNNFAFAIDVPELGVSASSPFRVLSSMFKDSRYPTISKNHLDTMFYIFEIPDYGHQALSAFYQDFMVMIFNSSEKIKIPQKYIGHIRAYHNKKMYIIIDREYKIKDSDSFDIRVIFKSGVDKVDSIELELTDSLNDDDIIFSKTFTKEEFPFTGKDITAFDIFIKKGDKLLRFVNTFNPDLFKITFDENPEGGKVIIHTQSQYFRDLYKTDFDKSESIPELSEESIEVKVSTLNLPECSIVLKTPHASPEYLLKMNENEEFFNTDYLAFDSSGKLLMGDISNASEFIPIFNKSRLIILYGTKPNVGTNWINQWLYYNKDIRYNMPLEERDYMHFNNVENDIVYDIVYIFDNGLPVSSDISVDKLSFTNKDTIEYHKLSNDEQKITVINDPYYVVNDLNDLTTGALHIIEPGNVKDERDITKELVDGSEMKPYNTELTEDLIDGSETEPYNNIKAYLTAVIDGFSEYKYITSEFLENFLKNSINESNESFNFESLETVSEYTKIFVIKMSYPYEKLNTKRGTEIIKGIKINNDDNFYYGITDSCPEKSADDDDDIIYNSIYRSLF